MSIKRAARRAGESVGRLSAMEFAYRARQQHEENELRRAIAESDARERAIARKQKEIQDAGVRSFNQRMAIRDQKLKEQKAIHEQHIKERAMSLQERKAEHKARIDEEKLRQSAMRESAKEKRNNR